jgi:hypothetical protein
MSRAISAYQRRRPAARAIARRGGLRSRNDRGVMAQAQIIIGSKINQPPTVALNLDGVDGSGQLSLAKKVRLTQISKIGCNVLVPTRSGHWSFVIGHLVIWSFVIVPSWPMQMNN